MRWSKIVQIYIQKIHTHTLIERDEEVAEQINSREKKTLFYNLGTMYFKKTKPVSRRKNQKQL